MGKLTEFIANSALTSIKETIKTANDMLQSFSFTDMGKALDETQTRMKGEVKRFINQIKNYHDRYVVETEFKPKRECLSYVIDGRTLIISVRAKDGSSNTSKTVVLPSDVDPNEMKQSYDSEHHVMAFRFKKKNTKHHHNKQQYRQTGNNKNSD